MTELTPLETIENPAFYYEALVLAGGRGSRMEGRDKGWIMWQGHPLIEHVLDRLKNQTVMPINRPVMSCCQMTERATLDRWQALNQP